MGFDECSCARAGTSSLEVRVKLSFDFEASLLQVWVHVRVYLWGRHREDEGDKGK